MNKRIIISGGGTGGHIFPAIAIADAVRRKLPDAEILFVGAEGRMEMEKVPLAGYNIEGLPVEGFRRKLTLHNFKVLFNLVRSLRRASAIIRRFKPDAVVGVGGYASGPVVRQAARNGIPALLQEQNSFPGVTNRLLAAKAKWICVAYDGMDKWFPAHKIVLTGNPLRMNYSNLKGKRQEAASFFGLHPEKPVVFVTGGSLGAATINASVANGINKLAEAGIQLLWQTGKSNVDHYFNQFKPENYPGVKIHRFIDRMDYAYSLADIIVARAGAITISELCSVGKPVILIPSPNVAEDHQTRNAMALVKSSAAIMIRDNEAADTLVTSLIALSSDKEQMAELSNNISVLSITDADERIAQLIIDMIR